MNLVQINNTLPNISSGLNIENVISFLDYKDIIRQKIRLHSSVRGYQGKLAKATGCHPSFISQVIKSEVHMNPDHAAKMAKFFRLDAIETDYFIELVNLSRAGSMELRELLLSKLSALREKKLDLGTRFNQPRLDKNEEEAAYYATWIWSAVHVLTSIPEFQTETAIAKRLNLSLQTVRDVLQDLEKFELVVKQSSCRWIASKRSIHLSKNSAYLIQHFQNWRHLAILSAQQRKPTNIHYSALHALSKKDIDKLRELALEFIDHTRQVVEPSVEQEMVCINLDLFQA